MNIFLTQHLRRWLFRRRADLCLSTRCASRAYTRAPYRGNHPRLSRAAYVRTKEGRVLAVGDLFQVVRGDRLTTRLLFGFKDGAVGDETAVFSQRGNFQLMTDRHIQKGPSFPHPMDLSIDVRSEQVGATRIAFLRR